MALRSVALNQLDTVDVEQARSPTQSDTVHKTLLREVRVQSLYGSQKRRDVKSGSGFWSKVIGPRGSDTSDSIRTISQVKLDIGGWVNLPPGLHQMIGLMVCYQDRTGEHSYIMDEMDARGAPQILLSGSREFKVIGKIKQMAVYCTGIEDKTVWIDDMHVKFEEK